MLERQEWNSPYINRTYWIFDHLQELKVTSNEALLLLVISYLNYHQIPIGVETLMKYCHLDDMEVDDLIASLSDKGYLIVDTFNNQVRFRLDGLIEIPTNETAFLKQPVIQEFEQEFKKTLSGSQMDKILQLTSIFGERMVLRALDEASAYEKRSIEYVENILISWKNRNLTIEDIEKGRR